MIMDKFTYFWCLIIVAMTFFFIGAYKNLYIKIVYILWVNRKNREENPDKGASQGWIVPGLKTVVSEALIQKRIKKRSMILWFRHFLIFAGFMTILCLDGFLTVAGHYVHHYFHWDYFMTGYGKAMLKVGMEFSGILLLTGLTLGIVHRLLFKESESKYVSLELLALLWLVAVTGFLTEIFRLTAEPFDPLKAYSFFAGPVSTVLASYPVRWPQWADAMWVIHATVTAVFFSYIPYSKFVHIFSAPLGRSLTQEGDYGRMKRERIAEGLFNP
jgi:nitrate reductase gamma subunit